jgi:hypothetical protein
VLEAVTGRPSFATITVHSKTATLVAFDMEEFCELTRSCKEVRV